MGSDIRYKLFQKIQSLTLVDVDKLSTSSLITRITNDVTMFQNTLVLILRVFCRSILIFLGGIIASFVYGAQLKSTNNESLWWLVFIVLGFLFLLMFVMAFIMAFAIPYFKKQKKN